MNDGVNLTKTLVRLSFIYFPKNISIEVVFYLHHPFGITITGTLKYS